MVLCAIDVYICFCFWYAANLKIKRFLTYFPWAEKLISKVSEIILNALYSFDYCMSSIFLEFRMIEILCHVYLISYTIWRECVGVVTFTKSKSAFYLLCLMLKRAQNRDKWNDEIWAYVLALIYVFSNQKTAEKISQQDCFLLGKSSCKWVRVQTMATFLFFVFLIVLLR